MTRPDALRLTAKVDEHGHPVPFSVHAITLNRSKKNKPSRHIRWKQAIRCGASHNLAKHSQIGIKPLDGSHPQVAFHNCLILKINDENVT